MKSRGSLAGSSCPFRHGGARRFLVSLAQGVSALTCLILLFDSPAYAQWTQVNADGFSDGNNWGIISAITEFNGQLYVGTSNNNGVQVWRSVDGASWNQVVPAGFGDVGNTQILTMIVFGLNIYAGTFNAGGAEIWRSDNGAVWNQVVDAGFGDAGNTDIRSMAVFGGAIYAGTLNEAGGELWSSATGNLLDWNQDVFVGNGFFVASNDILSSIGTFGADLYVGTLSDSTEGGTGCQVYQSPPVPFGPWTLVVDNGSGDANNFMACFLVTFGANIYAGMANVATGVEIHRSTTGGLGTWAQVNPFGGFGDSDNTWTSLSTTAVGGILYVGTRNDGAGGGELWTTPDGTTWTQSGTAGLGNPNNWAAYGLGAFGGVPYAGFSNNTTGCEVWRLGGGGPGPGGGGGHATGGGSGGGCLIAGAVPRERAVHLPTLAVALLGIVFLIALRSRSTR